MKQPRQRESLFTSEAEKDAEIARYQDMNRELARKKTRLCYELDVVIDKQAELSRRIQELQNLKLEL